MAPSTLPAVGWRPVPELRVGTAVHVHHGQDRLLAEPSHGLFAVFDGVGGHGDGGAAAEVAAEVVRCAVRAGLPACTGPADARLLVAGAVTDAGALVGRLRDASTAGGPSATTATVALVGALPAGPWDPCSVVRVLVAHVGNSRLHLLRAGALRTITLDHTGVPDPDPVAARSRQDRLDEVHHPAQLADPLDRALFHHRNLLGAALDGQGRPDLREYALDLLPGDRLALTTDGVHDNLTAAELAAALGRAPSAQLAATAAVEAAAYRSAHDAAWSDRCKPDDMTIVVLERTGPG